MCMYIYIYIYIYVIYIYIYVYVYTHIYTRALFGKKSTPPTPEIDSAWEDVDPAGWVADSAIAAMLQPIVLQAFSWSCAPSRHTCRAQREASQSCVLLMYVMRVIGLVVHVSRHALHACVRARVNALYACGVLFSLGALMYRYTFTCEVPPCEYPSALGPWPIRATWERHHRATMTIDRIDDCM